MSAKTHWTKKEAALQQIEAAIDHLYAHDYICPITLAGAAEGQIFHSAADHVWGQLILKKPNDWHKKHWVSMLNETRDWLKHSSPDDLDQERDIEEFETVVMLVGASSKFIACFGSTSDKIEGFIKWGELRTI